MGVSIGIVGLPNVGKSTLFNALTHAQSAESANYPFCTIQPNKAVVPVPDVRLERLAQMAGSEKTIHATVSFVDVAGLVKGASRGEGLGNRFLANIRETDAILQVVRCFEDEHVAHVDGSVDPIRDMGTIETELIMADLQAVESRLPRLIKEGRADKDAAAAAALFEQLLEHLGGGRLAHTFSPSDSDPAGNLFKESRLLTDKPMIYCCNVDEAGLAADNRHVEHVRACTVKRGAETVKICARLEEELNGMTDAERIEFLEEYGVAASGLDQVIRTGYRTLGLISYLTQGPKESRAWSIRAGDTAPKAAGVVHTDFERGFIRAQVAAYEDFVACKSVQGCREAGLLRTEGREYVVQDGDVIEFLFSV